ncbi:MAG: LptE family protein [Pseudomonadota bacterium]
MKKTLMTVTVLGLALAAFSCGYRLSGSGRLPGGTATIYVAMFENKTLEMGVEHVFTQAMISELVRRTGVKIVDEFSAQAVLRGTVTSITLDTLTRSADNSTVERMVYAKLNMSLVNREGETIWSVNQFVANEEYTVSRENETDEAAQAGGIERIARRIAERVVSAMTDDF